MSTIKPGRETNAKVAEALGWKLRNCDTGEYAKYRTDYDDAARNDGWTWEGRPGDRYSHEWRPSTNHDDALAALDATGEPWGLVFQKGGKYGCNIGPSHTWHYSPTLCLAACSAILAWHAAKGGK